MNCKTWCINIIVDILNWHYTCNRKRRNGVKRKERYFSKNGKRFSHDSCRSKNFPPIKRKSFRRLCTRAWRRRRGGDPSRQDKSERSFAKRGVIDRENLRIVGASRVVDHVGGDALRNRRGRGRRCRGSGAAVPERNAIAGAMNPR